MSDALPALDASRVYISIYLYLLEAIVGAGCGQVYARAKITAAVVKLCFNALYLVKIGDIFNVPGA